MTSALEVVAARLGARAEADAPLGARTTYRVGGAAALLVEARDDSDLVAVAGALRGTELPVLVVGRGSNLLVADSGFAGLVVVLGGAYAEIDDAERFEGAGRDDPAGPDDPDRADGPGAAWSVRAGGAVALPVLARTTAERGYRGLEWAVGVPGSVGGAVRMNAGGHGADTRGCLLEAEVLDLCTGEARRGDADDLALSYRHSALAPTDVVTWAWFAVSRGDADDAQREVREIVRWRREHQPGGTNAGSVFKNPPGDAAGRLVEAAGMKGYRLGTAEVSNKHANFIQADRGGRADDVRALIDLVAATVREREGVTLETEVVLVGYDA